MTQTKLVELTEKEKKLIELCRAIKFGEFVVHCEQGQPVRVEKLRESIKL